MMAKCNELTSKIAKTIMMMNMKAMMYINCEWSLSLTKYELEE